MTKKAFQVFGGFLLNLFQFRFRRLHLFSGKSFLLLLLLLFSLFVLCSFVICCRCFALFRSVCCCQLSMLFRMSIMRACYTWRWGGSVLNKKHNGRLRIDSAYSSSSI